MNTYLRDNYTLSARHMVMYPDCNATKNLFGGKMLAWIDVASAMYARDYMHTDYLVTKKIEEIIFQTPAPLGWQVTFYCKTFHEGRTSLGVNIVVTRQHFSHNEGVEEVVINTNVTFVSVDKDTMKPVPWKPVELGGQS
jgi:acyl-CoA thioesterase YciA